MMLIDSHCHLEAVLHSTLQQKILVPAICLLDSEKLFNYRLINSQAKIGFGIHPWFVDTMSLSEIDMVLNQQVNNYHPDFIGEIGLDKLKPNFDIQLKVFALQLKIANTYHLPVIIHCVKAYSELLSMLKETPPIAGIVHAFNENSFIANELDKYNLLLGIGSAITNKQSKLVKNIASINTKQIVFESDAPFNSCQLNFQAECEQNAAHYAMLMHNSLCDVIELSNINLARGIGL